VGSFWQWLRAAREDPAGRPAALRFALGVGLIQFGWVVRLLIGWSPLGFLTFGILGGLELAVPMWAERAGRPTPWNPVHIVERYGLFTIIVLGECVLATTMAIQAAFEAGGLLAPLLTVAAGGLLLVFGLWWAYFKHAPDVGHERTLGAMVGWGYGHYFVFAAVAALGAGLQVAAESTHAGTDLAPGLVAATVAIPVIVYLVALAILNGRRRGLPIDGPIALTTLLITAAAVAAAWIGVPAAVLAMGLLVAGLVAVNVTAMAREPA
jgi:low temperature requirement protein LtrA